MYLLFVFVCVYQERLESLVFGLLRQRKLDFLDIYNEEMIQAAKGIVTQVRSPTTSVPLHSVPPHLTPYAGLVTTTQPLLGLSSLRHAGSQSHHVSARLSTHFTIKLFTNVISVSLLTFSKL